LKKIKQSFDGANKSDVACSSSPFDVACSKLEDPKPSTVPFMDLFSFSLLNNILFGVIASYSSTKRLGVQIDHDVLHLRTSLVQEVVQIIELRRFGGAPNGYPFAALKETQDVLSQAYSYSFKKKTYSYPR
jgi:hypothetical protein